jgi:hypothetical protein
MKCDIILVEIYIPFVTLLSKLGLKASPEKSVTSPGCPQNLASL